MDKVVSKKMLINVMHPEEARVAIVHDGRLMELNIEISGKEQTKGNIYKGVVLRVEPGLQAAFVDIGRAKPGFLQMGELHPDFWQWREDIPEDQRKRRPRIQEVLRRGQELLVQVEKDERDNKGAALTTYVSMPGRYMVIMPGSDSTGISRKVEQEGARKKLKEIVAGLGIPEGIGYIIRTEAVGRTPEELQKDLDSLVSMYNSIKQSATEINGAGEVYRDSGLIIRFIRDYFSDDIDEVLVDSKEACSEAKAFFRENMPTCEKLVKQHKEKRPIFSRFQLEEQIDLIYEKRVPLPSGGSLIIEPTEALVSIDVNSGKSSGERGIEDTAFKTNVEAAEEVARQLRLRDLGGLIVIDFIDMRDRKHNQEVEKVLKQALKMDKARVNIGRISDFGMLEMSRQRIAKTLNDAIHLACPHCEGRGKVKSVEAMALSFLRKVHGAAAKGNIAEVQGGLPLEVAYYLLNRKKRELVQIENDYDIKVTVKGKTSFLLNQLELETVKREKSFVDESIKIETSAAANDKAVVQAEKDLNDTIDSEELHSEETAPVEAAKKRKRRRKKKKHATDAVNTETAGETSEPTDLDEPGSHEQSGQDIPAESGPDEITTESEGVSKTKKRKRRRSKKTHKEQETDVTGMPPESVPVEPEAATDTESVVAEPAPTEPEAAEKPKRKRPARKKMDVGAIEATAPVAEQVVEPAEVQKPSPAPKKARRSPVKKTIEEPAEPAQETVTATEEKPKRASRPRKKAPTPD
ncbi:MAG: Rne/Rng family ribonuclease [Geobacter sp.]|nr:Rne/Rng family ribonuclease [Geobacter sp.]